VLGAGLLAFLPRSGFGSLPNQVYSTGVGQQATVTLSDGSVVTLNTDTRLRTRAAKGRRLLYLEQGQAYFRVAKDPMHPFVVTAAGRTITAVGTAFDVRADAKRFEVTVVEGKVRVEAPQPLLAPAQPKSQAPPAKAEMTAGTQLVALPDAQNWRVEKADPAREVSWLRGYVVFQRAPFGEVASEMNRYTERKIIVDDPELAGTPISGAFKAGDVDAFVQAFEEYQVAKVQSRDAGAVRLSRF
jgi:transmembrane sensor